VDTRSSSIGEVIPVIRIVVYSLSLCLPYNRWVDESSKSEENTAVDEASTSVLTDGFIRKSAVELHDVMRRLMCDSDSCSYVRENLDDLLHRAKQSLEASGVQGVGGEDEGHSRDVSFSVLQGLLGLCSSGVNQRASDDLIALRERHSAAVIEIDAVINAASPYSVVPSSKDK
jgi:hypothetical protein